MIHVSKKRLKLKMLNPMTIVKPALADHDAEALQTMKKICNNSIDTRPNILFSKKKDYAIFNVPGPRKQVKLYIPDIMLATSDTADRRQSQVMLKNGRKYTLLYCAIDELLAASQRLVQVNKDQLVSIDAVNEIRHDLITLKGLQGNKPAYIALARDFRENLREKLFYR